MKWLRKILHSVSPLFRFVPFVLLGVCFIEIFFYDSNPYSLYKIFIGGAKEWCGFGVFGNAVLLYYFLVFKHCLHSIVSLVGMLILNLLNSVVMLIIFFQCWVFGLGESERRALILYNDKIITPYDCTIIIVTFIVAALFLLRKEILSIK